MKNNKTEVQVNKKKDGRDYKSDDNFKKFVKKINKRKIQDFISKLRRNVRVK